MESTNKSSLLKKIKSLKESGFRLEQIAKETGLSISYIKKLSARAGKKKTPVYEALEALQKNPYLDIAGLNLTESQKVMLYRSEHWLEEIKPARIIAELKNKPKLKVDKKYLNSIHKKTLSRLECMPEWKKVLEVRAEFEGFKRFLRQFRDEQKKTEHYKITNYGKVSLEGELAKLKEIKESIPYHKRYPMQKASTKRFAVDESIVLFHDEEYIRVCQNIRVIKSEILKLRVEQIEAYIRPLQTETKRLIDLYFGIPGWSDRDDKVMWQSVDELFEEIDNEAEKSNLLESYHYDQIMERENQKFIAQGA